MIERETGWIPHHSRVRTTRWRCVFHYFTALSHLEARKISDSFSNSHSRKEPLLVCIRELKRHSAAASEISPPSRIMCG